MLVEKASMIHEQLGMRLCKLDEEMRVAAKAHLLSDDCINESLTLSKLIILISLLSN